MERSEFDRKLEALAGHLSGEYGYNSERCNNVGWIQVYNSAHKYYFREGSYPARLAGRIIISGYFPRYIDGCTPRLSKDYRREITVSGDKSSRAIYEDMRRRFIPGYTAELDRVLQEIYKYDKACLQRNADLKKVEAAVGRKATQYKEYTGGKIYLQGRAKIETSAAPAHFDLLLHLTTEQTISVIDTLKVMGVI